MSEKVNILGVEISKLNIEEVTAEIVKMIEEGGFHSVFTPNSEIVMSAYKDPNFAALLKKADILTADGIGVVYASKILGNPIKSRAAGYDISLELMKQAAERGYSLYFFGAAPGVAETAKMKMEEKYKGLKVVGTHDGYFDVAEEEILKSDIKEKAPDILFVCLGSPKQEKWIIENCGELGVKVAIGLGGCLDVYAGNVKRAPDIYIKLGIEWLYRLIKEPKRFFRMLALPEFMLTVTGVKLFGKKQKEGI